MFFLLICLFQADLQQDAQWALEDFGIYSTDIELALGPAQQMAILDKSEQTWFILNNGKAKSFKRKGQGPGEMENPIAIFWSNENHSIYIHDSGRQRLLQFNLMGDWLKDHVLPSPCHSLVMASGLGAFAIENSFAHGGEPARIWAFQLGESKPERIWEYNYPDANQGFEANGFQILLSFAWDAKTHAVVTKGQLAVHFSAQPKVILFPGHQAKPKTWTFAMPTPALEKQQIQATFDDLSPMFKDGVIKNQKTPKAWPAVTKMLADEMGRIWLIGPPGMKGKRSFKIFEMNGTQVLSGFLSQEPLAVTQKALYTVDSEEDAPILRRMRLIGD